MDKSLSPEERAAAILNSLSTEEIVELFTEAGFEVSEGTGMIFNSADEVIYQPEKHEEILVERTFTIRADIMPIVKMRYKVDYNTLFRPAC